MNVAFDDTAATISKVEVVEQSETEGLGAKIAEPEFLSQFEGVSAPVYLPGMSAEGDDTSAASQEESTAEDNAALEALEGAELTDGTYTASTDSYDDSGFMDEVSLTVKDGKITEVTWDAVTEDGSKKSVMSENGEYVMTEDGPTWKEQAKALADALVENQSLGFFNTDEAGKTDSVSGVRFLHRRIHKPGTAVSGRGCRYESFPKSAGWRRAYRRNLYRFHRFLR